MDQSIEGAGRGGPAAGGRHGEELAAVVRRAIERAVEHGPEAFRVRLAGTVYSAHAKRVGGPGYELVRIGR